MEKYGLAWSSRSTPDTTFLAPTVLLDSIEDARAYARVKSLEQDSITYRVVKITEIE